MEIKAPDKPSFVMERGSSKPYVFLAKNVNIKPSTTDTESDNGGSDHHPFYKTMGLQHQSQSLTRRGHILQNQRKNPTVIIQAKQQYRRMLPNSLEEAQRAKTTEQLENAFENLRNIILTPWERTRSGKPPWFKPFWNDSLDMAVRHRRSRYRGYLTKGDLTAHGPLQRS